MGHTKFRFDRGKGRAWRKRCCVVMLAILFVVLVNSAVVLYRASDPDTPNPLRTLWRSQGSLSQQRRSSFNNASTVDVSTTTVTSGNSGFDMPTFNFNNVKLDKSRKYRLFEDVVLGEDQETISKSVVCLSTLSSLDRLNGLMDIAQQWDGPVSVAIFIRSTNDLLAAKQFIRILGICSDAVRLNFGFHFVLPVNGTDKIDLHAKDVREMKSSEASCGDQLKSILPPPPPIPSKNTKLSHLISLLFPQNHLRNLARDGCERMGARYFFLTDIDIIPKPALASQLNEFLGNRKDAKEIFIVPTYEMKESAEMPLSKADLLRMVKFGIARPFHKVVFIHNQYATNHDLWERLKGDTPEKMQVAYQVGNYEFFYEPFYVAPFTVPRHDERFIGYGFTRNTQVYETHLAGFAMLVLDEAFAVHRGIQSKKSRGFWREKQNVQNRRHFLQFKKDMAEKYGKERL